MKKWFSLVLVVALASISTPLEAGIFDRLEEDTVVVDRAQESIPLTDGGGEAVDPPPKQSHRLQRWTSAMLVMVR